MEPEATGDLDETQDLNTTVMLNDGEEEGTSKVHENANASDGNSEYDSTETVVLSISTEPIIPSRRRSARLGGKVPGSPSTPIPPAVTDNTGPVPSTDNMSVAINDDNDADTADTAATGDNTSAVSGETPPVEPNAAITSTPTAPIASTSGAQQTPARRPRQSSKERAFRKAADTIITYEKRSYRADGVDEECDRLKIKYRRWDGNDEPKEEPHASHLPFGSDQLIATEQHQHDYCILCPRKRALDENWDVKRHYRSVHEMGHLVVNDTILLVCKCSDVRSRGWQADKSTRNRHYHCIVCHHPRDNNHQIGNHMYKKHREISRSDVAHLLKYKVKAFSEPE